MSSNRVALLALYWGALLMALAWPRAVEADSAPVGSEPPAGLAPIIATTQRLADPLPCQDRFIAHPLPHVTTTADGLIQMFQANGAGLGVGDLDQDGDLDLLLGSETGPNSLLWNQGDLTFVKTPLGEGPTRAVTIVDIDADGARDIVLTTDRGAVNFWHNQGDGEFVLTTLPGVAVPAYVLDWGDLDQDGDLDLVTASYDAGFLTVRGNEYLLNGGSGVYLHENRDARFTRSTQLADQAQALALALLDLNDDGRTDLLVGNDFGLPDYAFVQQPAQQPGEEGVHALGDWVAVAPFAVTTHSTMSFEWGDIDNDGRAELFASDMKPYTTTAALTAAYAPLMAGMAGEAHPADDPQIMENVLNDPQPAGFVNRAPAWQIDGTGWSWSAKFGDLDNDGLLDLYVVNGMIEEEIFVHLPDHELVEENQAFRNQGERFVPMPGWGLNQTASGRAMVMADLDEDGDLDIVINNLRAPAQLLENRLCAGSAVEVELSQLGGGNPGAVGARLGLLTGNGMLYRDVRVTSGYLSGEPGRVHFGFPPGTELAYLEILWPDGALSVLDRVPVNSLVRVERQAN